MRGGVNIIAHIRTARVSSVARYIKRDIADIGSRSSPTKREYARCVARTRMDDIFTTIGGQYFGIRTRYQSTAVGEIGLDSFYVDAKFLAAALRNGRRDLVGLPRHILPVWHISCRDSERAAALIKCCAALVVTALAINACRACGGRRACVTRSTRASHDIEGR